MDDFARAAFARADARRSLHRRTLLAHVCLWAVVNAFLVLVWALAGGGYPWFLFPMAGWGVGVAAHGASLLLRSPDDLMLDRERERYTGEQGSR